jgi:hypothetical protein
MTAGDFTVESWATAHGHRDKEAAKKKVARQFEFTPLRQSVSDDVHSLAD